MFSARMLSFLGAGFLLLQSVPGQQSRGSQTPIGGTAPGNSTTNPSPTPTQPQTQPQPQNPSPFPRTSQPPIMLYGSVLLDDGAAPGEMVVIESVCNRAVRSEAYTDSKGGFSFELGGDRNLAFDDIGDSAQNGSRLPGASSQQSVSGGSIPGSAAMRLQNCELRARLPGYRSEEINVFAQGSFGNTDVGVIVLHRLGAAEGRVVSVTTLAAPKSANNAFEKGRQSLVQGKLDDARKNLEKATQLYPSFAAAWCALGQLDVRQHRTDDARLAFGKAIQADPKFIDPYLQLSDLQAAAKEWKELADTTATVIRLDPFDYPAIFFMNAVANYDIRNMEAAEKSARETEKLDVKKQYPQVFQLLALILASRGEYAEGASQMRAYLEAVPLAADAEKSKAQLAQFEALAGGGSAQASPQ
jgi:hypothetical protein